MSWSISMSGTPSEVANTVRQDWSYNMQLASTSEEAVRAAAISAVLTAIEANREASTVTINVYGSESSYWPSNENDITKVKRLQSVHVQVDAVLNTTS